MSKKNLTKLMAATFFAVSVGTVNVSASEITLDVSYWNPQVSGEIKSPSKIDLGHDLGLEQKNIFGYTLNFKNDENSSYFIKTEGATIKGDKNSTKNFTFAGSAYAQSQALSSEIKFQHTQVGYRSEHTSSTTKFSNIYSYHHNQLETSINNHSKDYSGDSFSMGWGIETMNESGMNYYAEINPLFLTTNNSIGSDYNIGINMKMSDQLKLNLGYKVLVIEGWKDEDHDRAALGLRGIYGSLSGSF